VSPRYQAFTAAGHEVVGATPGGVVPPLDQGSLTPQFNGGEEGAKQMADALASISEIQHPVNLDDYAAAFYPRGHGPMVPDWIARQIVERVRHRGTQPLGERLQTRPETSSQPRSSLPSAS
jgi:putative intracellular protease/amidase